MTEFPWVFSPVDQLAAMTCMLLATVSVTNDVQKYEVKNQATEETHNLTWKTPPI